MGQVLIRQPDGTWCEPEDAGYAAEAALQHILAEHPELVSGVSVEAVACRELQSAAGSADIVVVDTDGVRLRDAVAENLTHGRFRIVLAVDAINEPLKRMTEYLDAMSGPDTSIIAVEYARLMQGSVEKLMAQPYGEERAEAKSASGGQNRTMWDAVTYREWLEANEPASVPNFLAFIEEAMDLGSEFEGSRSVTPSGGLKIDDAKGRRLGSVSLFHFSGQGTSVEFNLIPMSRLSDGEWPPVGRNLRASRFTTRRPNVSLASLDEESVRRGLCALMFLRGSGAVPTCTPPLS